MVILTWEPKKLLQRGATFKLSAMKILTLGFVLTSVMPMQRTALRSAFRTLRPTTALHPSYNTLRSLMRPAAAAATSSQT